MQRQVRQAAARAKEQAAKDGQEAVEDAFAAEINTRVARLFWAFKDMTDTC